MPIEELRARILADVALSNDLRDWVGALMRPLTDHLAAPGNPSWYARFAAQVMADAIVGLWRAPVTDLSSAPEKGAALSR